MFYLIRYNQVSDFLSLSLFSISGNSDDQAPRCMTGELAFIAPWWHKIVTCVLWQMSEMQPNIDLHVCGENNIIVKSLQ